MPIRLNLLAEAQAAEEFRRKDPVKRAFWTAVAIVSLLLLWCSILQTRVWVSRTHLSNLNSRWQTLDKDYKEVVEQRRKSMDIEKKLAALEQLTTNRFLWGNALNALQQTMNGVDDIQMVRLKTEQTYAVVDESKGRTNVAHTALKPATATEKITMTLEAKDSSTQPGSQVNKYKETIAGGAYFAENLQKTNGVLLTTLSPPQLNSAGRGGYVVFTLQCSFPEKVRH